VTGRRRAAVAAIVTAAPDKKNKKRITEYGHVYVINRSGVYVNSDDVANRGLPRAFPPILRQ